MPVIAIDGPAASGKGTLARRLAAHFGFAHLDTGKLYRAVGRAVLDRGGDPSDPETACEAARALDLTALDDPALLGEAVGGAASQVAAIPDVRAILVDAQRRFAHQPPGGARGAVLDGRDIGTVICPDAEAKLFVTCDVEIRAKRRFDELRGRGESVIYAAVLEDLQIRDARDAGRSVAPLHPAQDAEHLDTTNMTADDAFDNALGIVTAKLADSLD